MLTIRRLALGSGYKYLTESIAIGDGPAQPGTTLSAYYEASGTPPGVWMGAGLAALDGGVGVAAGSSVDEKQLYNLLGLCVDPVSGEPCGRQPNAEPEPLADRVARRMARLPDGLGGEERKAMEGEIEAQERARAARFRAPVAAFDLTFSPQKSVSVAWALADRETQATMYECHRRAITVALRYAEEHMFHSRSGTNGVLQEEVEGVVAAAFTHYDSRTGDPQLHDHVVVWNRARSKSDGAWRTLDSRGLYRQVVTLSEIYDGVLEDMLTAELGVGWRRAETRGGQLKVEIDGVGEALLVEFSQRRREIDAAEDALVEAFTAEKGRGPSPVEKRRLAQQANLATRQEKQQRSLAAMSQEWRERARPYVGDGEAWVQTLKNRSDLPALRREDLADAMLGDLAAVACERTPERRSTFTRANVLAEVHRQLRGVRFAAPEDRLAVAERATELALGESLMVSAPELLHVPERYRRADGTSMLRPADQLLYTTESLLDAEGRLLEAGRETSPASVSVATVAHVTAANLPGREYGLSVDQALAVQKITTAGRGLDVLVGPAGTGKSTTMAGLRAVWEREHGAGSVLGLAPSAAAAEVLGAELGIDADNISKWLHEHRQRAARTAELAELERAGSDSHPHGAPATEQRVAELRASLDRWALRAGQIVIVDEASLAGTFALEELVSAAADAGAKVLLVGDPHQLSAVEAGGMFGALVRDRSDAPELADVRRFRHAWEKDASLLLRAGKEHVVDVYDQHDRITAGTREQLVAAIYAAWKADVDRGATSLMIAGDSATVAELNRRARADRVAAGHVAERGVEVAGEQHVGVGDEIVTRQNDRRLRTERGWVKNGDRWYVAQTHTDGSLTVRRGGGGGAVKLPAEYAAEHVELAYATTAHRAQGRTVDTAHAMVSGSTTREVLYVAATRGRESNKLYVDIAYDPDPESGHRGAIEHQTAHSVLAGVLGNEGAELAAHAQIQASWDAAEGLVQLHAEYLTIARAAQAERWAALIETIGLSAEQVAQVHASDAYGPLIAALRDAEARGLDVDRALPQLVAARPLADAEDVASVLHYRVDAWAERAASRRAPASDLIAGLIPRAQGVSDEDLARALREREQAIERRASALLERAIGEQAGWLRRLGRPPQDEQLRTVWLREARVVAAYRDRWAVQTPEPVDQRASAHTIEQVGHQKRAAGAAARALKISQQARREQPPQQTSVQLGTDIDQHRGLDR
ncbi:MAG: MobF family relaxase [Solirubrobacteraceae bacterium]